MLGMHGNKMTYTFPQEEERKMEFLVFKTDE
jgi:hypothetical protein